MNVRHLAGRLRRVATRVPTDPLRGRLDGFGGAFLSGWATDGGSPLVVELMHGDSPIAAALADAPRPDVADSGAGPLASGFRFDVEAAASALRRLDGGGVAKPIRAVVNGRELGGATQPLTADDLVDAAALAWAVQVLGMAA